MVIERLSKSAWICTLVVNFCVFFRSALVMTDFALPSYEQTAAGAAGQVKPSSSSAERGSGAFNTWGTLTISLIDWSTAVSPRNIEYLNRVANLLVPSPV
jgi:hypothetical protein